MWIEPSEMSTIEDLKFEYSSEKFDDEFLGIQL